MCEFFHSYMGLKPNSSLGKCLLGRDVYSLFSIVFRQKVLILTDSQPVRILIESQPEEYTNQLRIYATVTLNKK